MREMKKSLIFAFAVSLVLILSISSVHRVDVKAQTYRNVLDVDLGSGSSQITYTNVSEPVYFSAVATGGTPPYRYQWYYQPYEFGDTVTEVHSLGDETEGDASANFTFRGAFPAWYLISVRVWDSVGNEKYFWCMPIGIWVKVSGEPTSSPTPYPTPILTPSLSSSSTPNPAPSSTQANPSPTLTPSPLPSPTSSSNPTLTPPSSPTVEPTPEHTQLHSPTSELKNSVNSLLPVTGIIISLVVAVSVVLVYFFKESRD
jgi:hypothetical protein